MNLRKSYVKRLYKRLQKAKLDQGETIPPFMLTLLLMMNIEHVMITEML